MNQLAKKRHAFRPTITDQKLEERVVLSSANPLTPLPAAPPVSLASIRMQPAQMRVAYVRQVRAATSDLQSAIKADVDQLYSSGSVPTTQQLTNFNAEVAGAVNATALRLSSQDALLPSAGTRLIPAIQNALLGSGSTSLVSRLTALARSSRYNTTARSLQSALTTQINKASLQNVARTNNFFSTTSLNRLSVNSSGQRIPLETYMGGQLISQVGNTFGALAQSFPVVANSVLYPDNATTTTPTQQLFDQFGVQARNALSTAMYQVGSDLSVLPGTSYLAQQIEPALFGSSNSTSSLVSSLQNLTYGSSDFSTNVGTAFNTAFQNIVSPIFSYLRMESPSSISLPTSGFLSQFISQFSGSTFNSGFNNGFATSNSTGFIGFGTAPTSFNTNYSSGFNNLVSSLDTTTGLLGTTTTVGGVPVQSR